MMLLYLIVFRKLNVDLDDDDDDDDWGRFLFLGR